MIREKHIARTAERTERTERTAQAARAARVLRGGFAAFVAGVAERTAQAARAALLLRGGFAAFVAGVAERTAQAARAARVLRGGFAAFVAGVAALCCTACINDYPDETAQVRFPDGESIALQVSLFDVIEDDETDAASDLECMHNLRVIITHKEMIDDVEHEVIEYNRLIEFGGNAKYRYGYVDDPRLMFKVKHGTADETHIYKHIYLFANSEPILNRMIEEKGLKEQPDPEEGIYGGTHYNEEKIEQGIVDSYLKALREVTFSNNELQGFVKPADGKPANGIPMSAEYDIDVVPGNTGIADVCIMNAYIVRAANKITFSFTNAQTVKDIFIQAWGLDRVDDRSYLLPHVKGGGPLSGTDGEEIRDGSWIKWYADHIKSNTHTAELNYAVPGDAERGMGPYWGAPTNKPTWSNYNISLYANLYKHYYDQKDESMSTPGLYLFRQTTGGTPNKYKGEIGTVYFLESIGDTNQHGMSSESPLYHLILDTQQQQYLLNGEPFQGLTTKTYESHMDQITTLFRNTHVQVSVTFKAADAIDLYAKITPWVLDPTLFNGDLNEEEE